jgi:hypothetical protein
VQYIEETSIVDEIENLEKYEQKPDEKEEVIVETGDDKQEIKVNEQLLNASIESENIDTALESAAQSILQIQDISDGEIFNSSIVDNKADESTVMQLESADNSVIIHENNVTVDNEDPVAADNQDTLAVDNDDSLAVANEDSVAVDNAEPVAADNQDSNKVNDDAEEVEVSILFTAELNKDLETLSIPNADIEIYPVPTDLSKDELVLEIRRYVAEEAQISLSRVSLVLHGKVIMHGMDVDNSFTAANASKLAKSGELTVSIKSLNQAPPQASQPAPSATVPLQQEPVSRESVMSHSELEKIVAEVKKQDSTRKSHDDLVAGHFHSTRTSLDNTLNSLSDTEGLTDEELAEKLSDLRQMKQKISPHIDDHHGSIAGVLGNLSNISVEDNNASIEKRPDYLRLSLSNINRRSYDDDSLELPKFVDEPTNIKSNKSSSSSEIFTAKSKARSTVLESSESLAGAKRLDTVLNDDHDIQKSSNNIFNRESNDGYSTQFDSLTSSNLYGARESDAPDTKINPKNSVNSWDTSNISDDFAVDLDKTIDSSASGPTDVRMSSVLRKADEYERKASETSVNHTPIKDYKSGSKASTPSIASPFDNLIRSEYKATEKTIIEYFDGDDSLALSDDSRTGSEKFF